MTNTFQFFLSEPNLPFLIASCILVILVFTEILGLLMGGSLLGLSDSDTSLDGDSEIASPFYGILNPGQLASAMYLVTYIGFFAILGFLTQWISLKVLGMFLTNLLVVPITIATSLVFTSLFSRVIGPFIPKDETYVSSLSDFIGLTGEVVSEMVDNKLLGSVRIMDRFGTNHYLDCQSEEFIKNGKLVVVLSMDERNIFQVCEIKS